MYKQMTIDFTTEHGQIAKDQLENENVIWLTTVTPKGMPQPNPIWFVWENDSIVTWVQPNSARIHNLKHNNQASLNMVGDASASQITVLTGTVEIDESIGSFVDHAEYMQKYADRWAGMGMTAESAAEEYSLPLRFRPAKLRGF